MISNLYYKAYIAILLALNSTQLFHEINQVDWYQGTLLSWTQNIGMAKGDSIIEIGSATGVLTKNLHRAGYKVQGIDISEDMVAKAKEHNPASIIFEQGDIFKLPYSKEHFDHVIAASVINVIPDAQKGLTEMIRISKTGGKISVLVPQNGFDEALLNDIIADQNLTGFSREALLSWNRYARKMKTEQLVGYFKEQGLNDIQKHTYLRGMVVSVTGTK